ncbi:FkbM family methyltransferase [Candidatus Saccharibacteria bacterium]|nr:FkbM family methyltransferase [Candidatus Saccharibacteria bacterium]
MRKVVEYFRYFGFGAIKVIFFILVEKCFKFKNDKFAIKIKNKKTGKASFMMRPFTTDMNLMKQLLVDNGEYDFLYDKKYRTYCKAKVVIDAGANVGMFSRIIKEYAKDAKIIAIEPEQKNFEILKKNVSMVGDNDVLCLKNGLWNKRCKLVVESSGRGEWGFTVKEVKGGKYDVSAVSVLNLIDEYSLPRIDILKMDIEGSEYEVFDKSCLKWLGKVEMVITEIHDDIKEGCSTRVLKYMKEKGFSYERRSEMWIFTREKSK